MGWQAVRPFTLLGVRYQAGASVPDNLLIESGAKEKLIAYRRIAENEASTPTPSPALADLDKELKPLGYGWYEAPDGGKIHGKKAALAAIGG